MTVELTWNGKNEARALLENGLRAVLHTPVGASQPVQPLSNAHLLIEGDNLAALQALKSQDSLAFHFIYIDPPYNSGQNFTFKDSMAQEGSWLTFMYPRLALAYALLREEGVIFVSIDDRECAALTLLMMEIFGRTNHIATLKWRKKRKPSFLDKHLSSTIEYILVFAKNRNRLPRFLGEPVSEGTRPVLNASNQMAERVLRAGTMARCKEGTYPRGVRVNRTLELELLDDARVASGVLQNDVRVRGRFRVSQEILDKTVFITPQFGLRRTVEDSEKSRKHATDDCTAWPTNEDAETELRRIFGMRVFDFPKPVGLLQNLLKMCPLPPSGQEFFCLDFFAGSGTLAEAVLAQNQADGGRRTFVCVQTAEPVRESAGASAASSAGGSNPGLHTISAIMKARVQHAFERFGSHKPVVQLQARLVEPGESQGTSVHSSMTSYIPLQNKVESAPGESHAIPVEVPVALF